MSCTNLLYFFFNDTATTEIYTLSLHDALPISTDFQTHLLYKSIVSRIAIYLDLVLRYIYYRLYHLFLFFPISKCYPQKDRKSTRLNSSHANISYAVFCLKKKKQITTEPLTTKY